MGKKYVCVSSDREYLFRVGKVYECDAVGNVVAENGMKFVSGDWGDACQWFNLRSSTDVRFEEAFAKSLLCAGDLVTLRNGGTYVYIPKYRGAEDVFLSVSHSYVPVATYDRDLRWAPDPAWDVCKIERATASGQVPWNASFHNFAETVFARKVDPKKMTVSQVCAALGYEVSIVKE